MDKFIKRIKKILPTQRRLIQLYCALLYNAHIKGFIQGDIYTGTAKMLCVPGLNCYSCPGAIGACPLGALQNAVASAKLRTPYYVIGIFLLYGLIFGRTICGFLCPFGMLQELFHKLPTCKILKNRITRFFSHFKYVILIVFVFLIPVYYLLKDLPLPAFCKYICPAGTLEGAIGLLSHPSNADMYSMLGVLFTNKFIILLIIIGLCVFIYRAFCRFLCPLGAIYGLFSKVAVIGVHVDPVKCIDCGLCVQKCQMDIRHVGDHECIHCGECMEDCPTSAISFKAGKYTIGTRNQAHSQQKKQYMKLTCVAALIILVAAYIIFNHESQTETPDSFEIPNSVTQQENSEPVYEIGSKPGMKAPVFSAPLYNADRSYSSGEHDGKVIVINFWATWCTPCIKELPFFDEISRFYSDSVSVVALHSNLVTEDVEEFLSRFDFQLNFALDQSGEIIKSFGGSTMLPHTVILDKDGIVVYNATGSLTQDELHSLVQDALLN